MKTITFRFVFLVLVFFSIFSTSCSNDDDNPQEQSNPQFITELETNLKSGTWSITSFIDSESDETSHFSDYNFTFKASGMVTAENDTNSYEGSWSIVDNSDDDDDNSEDVEFNLDFNLSNDFDDLNGDWNIIRSTGNILELIDQSGGNGGTDYLTFERN